MKYIIYFLLLAELNINAQNKKILFNFDEIPQTLMVNPGAEVDFQWHIGMPVLSGTYVHVGISNFSTNDLFAIDGINFNTKLNNKDFVYP